MEIYLCKSGLIQGRLKIWTEHSTLILLIAIPFELAQQKFQDFYNYGRNEFSPNLKSVAQKLGPPRPFEVLDVFGGKSKSKAPNAFKFGTKWVPIEVNNWWKFGVDISNHFWEIQILRFYFFQVSPTWKKIVFENYFFSKWGTLGRQKILNFEFLKSDLRYQHQIFTSCKPQ